MQNPDATMLPASLRVMAFLGTLASGLALAPPASPCSPPCGVTMTPPGGTVPANLSAFHVSYRGPSLTTPLEERVKITEVLPGGSESPMPVIVGDDGSVLFGRHLVEGATYKVAVQTACDGTEPYWFEQQLVAGPEAPPPTTLGAIEVANQVLKTEDVWTVSGSCTSEAEVAARDVTLVLAPDAEPWKRAMRITWSSTTSRRSQLSDLLPPEDRWQYLTERMAYHVCDTSDDGVDPGDPEGASTVTATASIPGLPTSLSAQANLTLSCDDDTPIIDGEPTTPQSGSDDGCTTGLATVPLASLLLALTRRRR